MKDPVSLNKTSLPRHIAIIMDGNGRWAQRNGKVRMAGHQKGVDVIRHIVEYAARIGIQYLTLYTFSIENWERPKIEVEALMNLLIATIENETNTLMQNNIRLRCIGNISQLPEHVREKFNECIAKTANNKGMELVLAVSYSARWEITNACKKLAREVLENKIRLEDINETLVTTNLTTASMPDPDLLIRTSGELRLSNFLLWQLAYSELYFTDKLWPDFTEDDFYEAIVNFQKRERRFGKISEQK